MGEQASQKSTDTFERAQITTRTLSNLLDASRRSWKVWPEDVVDEFVIVAYNCINLWEDLGYINARESAASCRQTNTMRREWIAFF